MTSRGLKRKFDHYANSSTLQPLSFIQEPGLFTMEEPYHTLNKGCHVTSAFKHTSTDLLRLLNENGHAFLDLFLPFWTFYCPLLVMLR